MEFIVWIILLALYLTGTLLFHYWYNLIRDQDSYTRRELLGLGDILSLELKVLSPGGELSLAAAGFATGAALSWFFAGLGGLVTPDLQPIPDMAEASLPNYFFQSPLVAALIHLLWPFLQDLLREDPRSRAILKELDLPLFAGAALGLPALSMALWGVYHDAAFLFSFFSAIFSILYILLRMQRRVTAAAAKAAETGEEELRSDFSSNLDDDFPDAFSGDLTGGKDPSDPLGDLDRPNRPNLKRDTPEEEMEF